MPLKYDLLIKNYTCLHACLSRSRCLFFRQWWRSPDDTITRRKIEMWLFCWDL